MTIGEHMKKARESKGLSMSKLGELAGVHKQTIYAAESNRAYTSILNVICLADALKISIDEYIGRKVLNYAEGDNFVRK